MDESSIIPAEKVAGAEGRDLQGLLKAAVKSVEWTYSLFWQLCPQQRVLVWGNGYYNGAIKTRKTTHPAEVTAEEAALERSQQLRELYETLLAGESSTEARACTALSPEDLTETEWFYLMCVSFSFPPPSGLPGKAYARRKHVWLSGANDIDSKIFSRAILAKSAKIQTVVCIPMLDGVVELGTTNKVKEDIEFVKHIKSNFFPDHFKSNPMPLLSEHSTYEDHEVEEEAEEYHDEEDHDEEEVEVEEEMTMSEEIRLGSPDDEEVSIQNLRSEFHTESTHTLDTHMDMMNLMEEGGNYSQTVSTLLMSQPTSLFSDSVSTASYIQSSFTTWTVKNVLEKAASSSLPQWMLKHMILRVPFLHENTKDRRLPREDLNHVVAERRRREKLNKRFITLRTLVPFVTKMDKVSILGDTIEYVNHLRKRVLELETEMESQQHKRMRTCKKKIVSEEVVLEVSIIESDVLLEMRCEYRDGLLLDILQVLKELGIETTAVHTAVNDHEFEADIRGRVRGKKVSISEVKRAINQVIITK